jgi:hypothetical protein
VVLTTVDDICGTSLVERRARGSARVTARSAVFPLFILQRRCPAHPEFVRNSVEAWVACFLPKDIVTPNIVTSKPPGDASTHGDPVRASSPGLCDRVAVEARLLDVAASDAVAEIVIVLRGRVRPWRGAGRGLWRVGIGNGHYRILSTHSVIAVTPVTKRPRSRTQSSPEDEAADQ